MLTPCFKSVNPVIAGNGVNVVVSFESTAYRLPFKYFLITTLFCPVVSLIVSISSPDLS